MELATLRYRGFTAGVKFSPEDRIFHGEIQGIRPDSVSFEGRTTEEAHQDFREAVDDYLKHIASRPTK